jgi:hypothetical protein
VTLLYRMGLAPTTSKPPSSFRTPGLATRPKAHSWRKMKDPFSWTASVTCFFLKVQSVTTKKKHLRDVKIYGPLSIRRSERRSRSLAHYCILPLVGQ